MVLGSYYRRIIQNPHKKFGLDVTLVSPLRIQTPYNMQEGDFITLDGEHCRVYKEACVKLCKFAKLTGKNCDDSRSKLILCEELGVIRCLRDCKVDCAHYRAKETVAPVKPPRSPYGVSSVSERAYVSFPRTASFASLNFCRY